MGDRSRKVSIRFQILKQQFEVQEETERFFRQLADAVPQIAWIVEPDATLSYTNQQGSDFLGRWSIGTEPVSLSNTTNEKYINIVHPEDRALSLTAWRQSLETGEPYEVQLRMQDTSGTYRWFFNRAIAIRDSKGAVIKWFGTSTDLGYPRRDEDAKQLQDLERRLRQNQRTSQLQWWLLGIMSVAFVIATALGIFAFSQT
ncbi:MAG: PAS domain-containing protein [Elainellaceae cyanobacterium]